jgi:hypothetical protein
MIVRENINFERGGNPRDLFKNSLEIQGIGYNINQPHNKEMIERILNSFYDTQWDGLKVFFYLNDIFMSSPVEEIRKNPRLTFLKWKGKYYKIKNSY